MALFSDWQNAPKITEQTLSTTYTRETVFASGSDIGAAYLRYTRTRTKKYKYIGLSQSAATACAAAKNLMLCRKAFTWVWDSTTRIWKMSTDTSNRNYVVINAGTAVPSLIVGDDWQVSVDISEQITIPFRNTASEDASMTPSPWTEFEANPAMMTNAFKGFNDTSRTDFDYDEA